MYTYYKITDKKQIDFLLNCEKKEYYQSFIDEGHPIELRVEPHEWHEEGGYTPATHWQPEEYPDIIIDSIKDADTGQILPAELFEDIYEEDDLNLIEKVEQL